MHCRLYSFLTTPTFPFLCTDVLSTLSIFLRLLHTKLMLEPGRAFSIERTDIVVDNATMNGWGGVCEKLRGESSRRLESLACRPSIAAGFPTVRLASSPQDSDLIDDDGITATPDFPPPVFFSQPFILIIRTKRPPP